MTVWEQDSINTTGTRRVLQNRKNRRRAILQQTRVRSSMAALIDALKTDRVILLTDSLGLLTSIQNWIDPILRKSPDGKILRAIL